MEVVRLKNVKLANAIKVDVENTVFKNDNYDIVMWTNGVTDNISVRHKISRKTTTTTTANAINVNYEDESILDAVFANPKAAAPVKVVAPAPEPVVVSGKTRAEIEADEKALASDIEEQRRLAKIADREKRLASKGAPPAVVPLTEPNKAKKSNKTNANV